MKLNKKQKSVIAIYGIVLVVFVLLTLIVPLEKNGCSWTMFAFSVISILFSLCATMYAFSKSDNLTSKFYGFPIFKLGALYTIIQLGLTIILGIVCNYVDVPAWVGWVISLILIACAGVGCITADNSRDIIEEIEAKQVQNTQNVKLFQTSICDALDLCKDDEIRPALQKLVNRFKYSDPVSNDATIEKEETIKEEINLLINEIPENNKEALLERITKIDNLLSSRNRLCEQNKK